MNDYDRPVRTQQTMVDVRIPYRGDGKMFRLAPSSRAVITETVQVQPDSLLYTMPYDPAQQRNLDRLIGHVETTLDTMRQEEAAFAKRAVADLQRVAEALKKKLEDDDRKGREFGFPID